MCGMSSLFTGGVDHMSDEMLETLTLAGIVLAVTLIAVGVILLIRRRSAGQSGVSSGSEKKSRKTAKQQKPGRKKEKGKKKNKKQKNEAGYDDRFIQESNDTIPLIPTDTSDETIPLYESDPRYPHDNGGETVLLAETEEPDFKIDFEIGYAESKDVIE
jgi:hypothetical protein